MKICSKCKQNKFLSCFYKCAGAKDGLKHQCKECSNKYYKKWSEDNKENLLQNWSEYRKNNKEKILQFNRGYYYTTIKNDPVKNIRKIVSHSINKSLKLNNSSKNGKSITKHLSYTIEDLKEHLRSQFEPWMSWNNHGAYNKKTWKDDNTLTWFWQIDHIIPVCNFNYTSMNDPEFQKCWALENLRPLSAKQNIIDNARKGK